jgi:hypothetical protein
MISYKQTGKAMLLVGALMMGSIQICADAGENAQEASQSDVQKDSKEEISDFDLASTMLISGCTGIVSGYLCQKYDPLVALIASAPVMLLGHLYQRVRCGNNDKYRVISKIQAIGTGASALVFMFTWHQLRNDLARNMYLMMSAS